MIKDDSTPPVAAGAIRDTNRTGRNFRNVSKLTKTFYMVLLLLERVVREHVHSRRLILEYYEQELGFSENQ